MNEGDIKTDSGKPEDIYQEVERGCGWRKIGAYYLVADSGMNVGCDALPLDLDPCGECGYDVPFSRTMQMVHQGYLVPKILFKHATPNEARRSGKKVLDRCRDKTPCPICNLTFGSKFALMVVSSKVYTPQSFIEEARTQGISKRIDPRILPKDFKLGETWVFLMHKDAISIPDEKDPEAVKTKRGIFYAFKPERIEAVRGDNENPTITKLLGERGFKVVKVPHNDPKHQQKKPKKAE
jgi:hypothetical protein